MEFEKLAENGPVILTPKIHGDHRGYFMETFRQNEFEKHCGKYAFVQDNQSQSCKNVLRGLHYQLNNPQGKLVRVIAGKVFDACVDLRQSSPNFGKSYSVVLDDQSYRQFWVPPGFAHGFMVMSDKATFVYKCTTYYDPTDEYCLLWNDSNINIQWPISEPPILSSKDLEGLGFKDCAKFK